MHLALLLLLLAAQAWQLHSRALWHSNKPTMQRP
jgi:hypothetical protein